MTDTVRLAKRMAALFACSRAEATQYIEGGWVKVDGQVIEEPGCRVSMQAQIELLPNAIAVPAEPATLLLHKPSGMPSDAAVECITADNLSADDRSGRQFLKRDATGLSVMAALETSASGLLILTQDWRIVRKFTDDAGRIEQEYLVEVSGELIPDGLALLNNGLIFEGKTLPPMKVSWQNETRLRMAIKAPPAGLIEHLCQQVGLTVVSAKRMRLGRVPMAGLKAGQWRFLTSHERF